jgi:hypothetical protein
MEVHNFLNYLWTQFEAKRFIYFKFVLTVGVG